MKKKLTFIFFGFFLFFILFFILIISNLNNILNHPKFHQKLEEFFRNNYHIDLKYDQINVNLSKGEVSLKNFYFKSKIYKLSVPQGYLNFSFSKILKLNFYPEEIRVSNIRFEKHFVKKIFNLRKLIQTLHKLSPLYLTVTNATINYEIKSGWFNFKDADLKLRIGKKQVLYEAKAKSNIFKDGNIKGRFDYKNIFLESLVDFKNLDLAKFKKILDLGISKTEIKRLKSEIVLEKKTLNIAFVALDPYIIFKKIPFQKLLGGYIEGIVVADKKGVDINLNLIKSKFPKIKGSLHIKKKDNYKLIANAEEVDLSSIKDLALKLFPKNKSIKKIFNIVQKGILYDLKIENSGDNLRALFNVKNLSLKSSVSGGNISLTFLPFPINDIKGELAFKDHSLFFSGKTLIDKNIVGKVDNLELKFLKKKKPYLKLKGTFIGEAESLKTILMKLSKKLTTLKEYNFKGLVKGRIELKGHTSKSELKGEIEAYLNNFMAKIPYYKNLIYVKKGSIFYDFDTVKFKNLKTFTKNIFVDNLNLVFYLKNSDFNLLAENATISKEIISEIKKRYSEIKDIFSRYKIDFQKIKINSLIWNSNLDLILKEKTDFKNNLKKNLVLSGVISGVKVEYPYRGEIFELTSPELSFEFNKGVINIKESLINLEDSSFRINGTIKDNKIEIKGTGQMNKILKNKIENLMKLPKKYDLKDPIRVSFLDFVYDNGTFSHSGEYIISKNYLKLDFKKDKKINCKLKWISNGTDFKINLTQKFKNIIVKTKGNLDLSDINHVFKNLGYKLKGKLESSIYLTLPVNIKIKNLKELSNFYLNNLIFGDKSYLKIKNAIIKFPYNKILSLNLTSSFYKKVLKISDFSIKWNGSLVKGDFKINKKSDYFYLTGNLKGKEVNLKKLLTKKEKKNKSNSFLGFLDGIPLIADLNVEVGKLIFPTSHYIEDLRTDVFLDNTNKILIINLPEADFCGLKLQAIYEKELNKQDLYIKILPSQGDFLDLFSCLYPEEMPKVILEGPYKIRGYIYTEGDQKDLLKKSTGEIEVRGKKGYIYRAPLLARLFGFLSPIDLFQGKIPNLENNLLAYEELDIKGVLKNSTLRLKNAFLSATGFRLFGKGTINFINKKLNLTFYVSPFKTLDIILENIPFLGKRILGEQRMLIYLPLEVVGTYDNYQIIPLHPSSIGKGFFDFIFRIFGIPEEFYKNKSIINKFERKGWLKEKNERKL